MQIELNNPVKNLLYSDFEDKTILSFELDKQQIKSKLQELGFQKIYNFDDNLNFIIQIDSKNTFDTINLQEYKFKNLQHYSGKLIYSCIIKIAERQLEEESTFYFRVKIEEGQKQYNIKKDEVQGYYNFDFVNEWSTPKQITIKKNYTMDILLAMYNFIADYNAYNKEIKSANFYNFLLPHAKELNSIFAEIIKSKDLFLLDKCDTNELDKIFGNNYGFNIPFNMNTEEYRRVIENLRVSYMKAGTYDSINTVIKYFLGENAIFSDYRFVYPWILRNREIVAENPSYNNYKSNYYVYNNDRYANKLKNEAMILSNNFKKFNFKVKFDNFFNTEFDKKEIEVIINKLKPVYDKYILRIEEVETFNPPSYISPLLVKDDVVLKGGDESYIKYK